MRLVVLSIFFGEGDCGRLMVVEEDDLFVINRRGTCAWGAEASLVKVGQFVGMCCYSC